jgi:Leucine Rich repeat
LTECNTTLKWLSLEYSDAQPISADILFDIEAIIDANKAGIRLLHAESVLDLSYKRIDDKRARQIAKELACNSTIRTLILSKNDVRDEGSVDIANALINNRTLTSIRLDDNLIGNNGCYTIAEALRMNKSLQVLGLGRNCIGDDGAVAIADSLRTNATVTRLYLDGNCISDGGAMSVLTLLKNYNHTLLTVNLLDNIDVPPVLWEKIDFLLVSRVAHQAFLKRLHKPLEKRLIPLAIRTVSLCPKISELGHGCEMTAGPVFHLVRASASEKAPPSRKRSRES